MRRPATLCTTIAALISLATWLSVRGAAADATMKSSNAPTGAACSIDGPKSACGLPSNVVIDMSKTQVRHTDAEWRQLLTPEQYRVARQQGTEPAFHNAYWNNHADGVYFSVVQRHAVVRQPG